MAYVQVVFYMFSIVRNDQSAVAVALSFLGSMPCVERNSYGNVSGWVAGWLAGWVSVTLRYCIKTAKPI